MQVSNWYRRFGKGAQRFFGLKISIASGLRSVELTLNRDHNGTAQHLRVVMTPKEALDLAERLERFADLADPVEIFKTAPLGSTRCAHGNNPTDCDACFRASDHAFDAAREDRFR